MNFLFYMFEKAFNCVYLSVRLSLLHFCLWKLIDVQIFITYKYVLQFQRAVKTTPSVTICNMVADVCHGVFSRCRGENPQTREHNKGAFCSTPFRVVSFSLQPTAATRQYFDFSSFGTQAHRQQLHTVMQNKFIISIQ